MFQGACLLMQNEETRGIPTESNPNAVPDEYCNMCPCAEIIMPHIVDIKRQLAEIQSRQAHPINNWHMMVPNLSSSSQENVTGVNDTNDYRNERRSNDSHSEGNSGFNQLDISKIDDVFRASVSRSNFATNLVKSLYESHELVDHNCRGLKGKLPLSPRRLQYIQGIVFQKHPLRENETAKEAWGHCRKVIDSSLRQINKQNHRCERTENTP